MSTSPDSLRKRVVELAEACLRNTATAEQHAELDSLLQAHAAARSCYLQFIQDTGSLRGWALANTKEVEGEWPPQLPPEQDPFQPRTAGPGTLPESTVSSARERRKLAQIRLRRRRLVTRVVVAIGAFLLLFSAGRLLMTSHPLDPAVTDDGVATTGRTPDPAVTDDGPVVATILRATNTRWRDGERRIAGDDLSASQRIQLEAGLARIRFLDGATATLEGPAELDLLSAGEARLHRGRLTLWVPPEAVGFRVRTKAVDIIDLGTSFGVLVEEDGDTNVSVFSGQVQAALPDTFDSDPAPQIVSQGESIRVSVGQTSIDSVGFDADPFEKPLKVSRGIVSMEGDCRFVAQRVTGGMLPQDDSQVLFGLERRNFVLPEDLKVNLRPDIKDPVASKSTPIPAGTRIHCFLGQFDPPDDAPKRNGHVARFRVTFEQPIIGIIAGGHVLKSSDRFFADQIPNLTARQRASEPPSKNPREQDTLILSDDRRTIEVTARVMRNMDQTRILVAAMGQDINATEVTESRVADE